MDEYSLARAFKRIEQELIFSMIRNFEKHKAEELEEGFNWDQWQVVQLKELEKYRQRNLDRFDEDFGSLNRQIAELFRMASEDGQAEEEARILEQILKGLIPDRPSGFFGINDNEFFGINDRKLESLIKATTDDMTKAEYAVLRKADDVYRRTIYDAQVYAANGGTYEQAIDMATQDFCKKGITSIVYKNGSRRNIADYAEMAIRTGNKRAYLMGEGRMHAKYGVHTVYVKKRPQACPLCLPWTGRVLIDDVYGGGTAEESRKKGIPLLSTAMRMGFLHPNCKDIYSLFIPGVDKETEPWTEEEIRKLARDYNREQMVRKAERMAGEYDMLARTRLDPDNRRVAQARADGWKARAEELLAAPDRSPVPETAEATLARFKKLAEPKTSQEILKQVNPHYDDGPEYQRNCVRCAAAEELLYRGYDVTARPYANDAIGNDISSVWEIAPGLWNDPDLRVLDKAHIKWGLEDAFDAWGDGARAVIRLGWDRTQDGHAVYARKINGVIIVEDPQIGKEIDIEEYARQSTGMSLQSWIMRVDNRPFTDNLYLAAENV